MVRTFYKSWDEAKQGRKDEAQKIAEERDKFRSLKYRWKDACYATRYVALKYGAPPEDLPKTPDDK